MMDGKDGKGSRKHGLQGTPGDRGDASMNSGISGIKSGYAGKLKSDCSKGYEDVSTGWGGNVRR
jgi:hypothetical protein